MNRMLLQWLLREIVIAAAAIATLLPAAVAAAELQRIDRAERRPAGDPSEAPQLVRLPDPWNPAGRSGTWLYSMSFEVAAPTADDWAIFIPRVGNRARLTVNGSVVGRLGTLDGGRDDHAQRPHMFLVPHDVLLPRANRIEVLVQGERARYAGLSALTVGPAAQVHRIYFWRELLQTWGSFGIVAVSVVLAIIAGALTAVTRDRAMLWFTLAGVFCAVRTSYALVIDTPFDWRLWNLLCDACYTGYVVALCLFCLETLQLRQRWPRWGAALLVALAAVLLPWYAFGREVGARQAWTMAMLAYSMSLSLLVIHAWWRQRTANARTLALAGAAAVALGLHDHIMVFYTRDGFGAFALARYSLLIFLVAMAAVLAERYRSQQRQEQALRERLASDLEARTRELMAQFAQQRRAIEQAAHERERERLIQDLHDGIGLQLNTLLGLAEARGPSGQDIREEVQTAIEQLRLLVDNTSTFDGGFVQLLGHIRYRIEQRLRRAGIALEWSLDPALPDEPVVPAAAVALQHLLFEVGTNILKHSRARRAQLHVAFDAADASVTLTVTDDGIGFDESGIARGAGLRSMRRRVADLGGELNLQAQPGQGVRLVARFPLPVLAPAADRVPQVPPT